MGIVKLLDRMLKTEIEELFLELSQFAVELLGIHFSEFLNFHGLTLLCVLKLLAGYKLALDGQFVHSETHSFSCRFFTYTADFK